MNQQMSIGIAPEPPLSSSQTYHAGSWQVLKDNTKLRETTLSNMNMERQPNINKTVHQKLLGELRGKKQRRPFAKSRQSNKHVPVLGGRSYRAEQMTIPVRPGLSKPN